MRALTDRLRWGFQHDGTLRVTLIRGQVQHFQDRLLSVLRSPTLARIPEIPTLTMNNRIHQNIILKFIYIAISAQVCLTEQDLVVILLMQTSINNKLTE